MKKHLLSTAHIYSHLSRVTTVPYVLEGLTKHLQILVIRRPLCLPFLYSLPSFHTLTNCSNRGSLALDLNQCVRMHCPQYIPVSRGSLGHRLCYFHSQIALILTSTRDKSATPELTMRPVTSRQKQRPSFKNLWSGSAYTPHLITSAAPPGRSQTLWVVGYSWDTCSHSKLPLGFGHQEHKLVHSSQGRTPGCPVPKTDRRAILLK